MKACEIVVCVSQRAMDWYQKSRTTLWAEDGRVVNMTSASTTAIETMRDRDFDHFC